MAEKTILNEVYKDYFKIGVATERVHERNPNNEIGNPAKEAVIAEQFGSMTFCNELKPMYNMGFTAPEAKEDYLPFVINQNAKELLDWAKANGMPVRGHVLVWHSQCPKEVFCKNYTPVTIPTDPELLKERPMLKHFEKLDPVCYVDRETMLKRLRSYIYSLMEYMYANDYATTIYAWDVVNEAIELADKTETGLRNSYWYQVIGDDFIYWAFLYARGAELEMSARYAARYGIDPKDEAGLKKIQPKLFYNDYNEWMADKKAAIIGALTRKTSEHGSIVSEGLIDGIGMQGHLSDNNNIDEYIAALEEYAKLVSEVHITELDVKCTCTNRNAEYYQALFYRNLFERLLQAKREGNNLTAVTLWGLTDDNSWIRGANPLLYHADLSTKKAYDALIYAVQGGDLGQPEKIILDLSDRHFDFEPKADGTPVKPEELGFKMRGFGEIELTDKVVHSGKYALANEKRFGDWCGISLNVSDFIGQTIRVSGYVKSAAEAVNLTADLGNEYPLICTAKTADGEWSYMEGTYTIPSDVYAMFLNFSAVEPAGQNNAVYVDDMEIKLLGLYESFEGRANIAAIRGAGHLPFLYVNDKESRDGKSHSLCVTRQEKDATVKLNIAPYIGHTVSVTVFVKTTDKVARIGLDGAVPTKLTEISVVPGEWNEIKACVTLPEELNSAEIYVETDGNADLYLDDISVVMCE